MITLKQARLYKAEIQKLLEESRKLYAKADAEKRSLTDEEEKRVEAILADVEAKKEAIKPYEQPMPRLVPPEPTEEPDLSLRASAGADRWMDLRTGQSIDVLTRSDSFADRCRRRGQEPVSLGRMLRGVITGKWNDAEREQQFIAERRALGEDVNWQGGYLVPDQLAANVIDLARAKTVLLKAGALSIPMESDHLTIARLAGDATIEEKAENAAFSTSEQSFDSVGLTATTYGQVVYASQELAEDAPNFGALIERSLANAMAAKIDSVGLSAILGFTNLETVAVGGAITYEKMLDAAEKIELNNAEPNAYVFNPAIWRDLRALTTGDGTNSAKNWLGPPPGINELEGYGTTSIALANGILGDFRQLILGLRGPMRVQVTDTGGDNTFGKFQIGIRVIQRFDWNAQHQDHLCSLTGITS